MTIRLDQAQQQLDALLAAQANNMLIVSIGGRSVTYRDMAQVLEGINYWQRVVAGLKREAAGGSRHGMSVVSFR
jgi:hypothetical protein